MKLKTYMRLGGAAIALTAMPAAMVSAATLNVTGGTRTFIVDQTFESITQSGGTIDGTATLTSNGAYENTGGGLGGGVTVISDGFTLDGGGIAGTVTSSGAQVISGGTISGLLNGTGAVTVTGGQTFLQFNGSGILNAASLEVAGGLLALGSAADSTIDTSGNSITVSGGRLSFRDIADDETVTVTGGIFNLERNTIANLTQTGGEVTVSDGSIVTGTFTHSGGTLSQGPIVAGTYIQSDDVILGAGTTVTAADAQLLQGGTIAGALDGAGAVTVSGGTTLVTGSITGAADLTVAGGRLEATGAGFIDTATNTVTVSGGTLSIGEGAIASGENLVIEGGTVTGGDLQFSSLTQSGGLIAEGISITTLSRNSFSGGTIAGTVSRNQSTVIVADLTSGTTTLSGTMNGGVNVREGATFNIEAGGVLDTQQSFVSSNLGTLNNAGTVDSTISLFFINDGVLTNSGTFRVGVLRNSGTLQVDGTLGGGSITSTDGVITGSGTIDSDVTATGTTIAPGNSPGTLTIDGDLTATESSVFAFELGGLLQGNDYDWLNVSGRVAFGAGTLFDIDYFEGFEAKAGDMFDILTGDSFAFSNLSGFEFDFADIATTGIDWSASRIDVDGGRQALRLTATSNIAPVPLPAGGWLLLGGLAWLGALRRRGRAT